MKLKIIGIGGAFTHVIKHSFHTKTFTPHENGHSSPQTTKIVDSSLHGEEESNIGHRTHQFQGGLFVTCILS